MWAKWGSMGMWWLAFLASTCSWSPDSYSGDVFPASPVHLAMVEHPLNHQLLMLVKQCAADPVQCDNNHTEIIRVGAKLANEHAILLLHDRAKNLFDDIVYYLGDSLAVSSRLAHMGSVLAFAQGNVADAQRFRQRFNLSDLVVLRTAAAQTLIMGEDAQAVQLLTAYARRLESEFRRIVNDSWTIARYSAAERAEQEEFLLSLLLSEAQGGVRTLVKLGDLPLMHAEGPAPLDERFRFRLGVGLTKLGLYDLSLHHVGLAATPWESPLYRLRAKLVFAPVHASVGALAMAVNHFERQIESILLHPPVHSAQMVATCLSLNEAALALQALPLLHVVGFASPTRHSPLGHLPVPLPALLSEVYQRMCPPAAWSPSLSGRRGSGGAASAVGPGSGVSGGLGSSSSSSAGRRLQVGVMAGSLDGPAGKIVLGLLDGLTDKQRRVADFVALCFPTARSAVTDRLTALFAQHVNLVPENKTLSLHRIRAKALDVVLFADAAADARVFALAHERLAPFQAVLWGWGGSLGVPAADFYLLPDVLVATARCRLPPGDVSPLALFHEQPVLLRGLPSLPTTPQLVTEDLWQIMRTRYLLELGNRTHVYLLPASVKLLHPQFDRALEVLLATDPIAVVVLAVVRTGRDALPPTHIAVRHDLLHPAMPPAAVARSLARLRARLGDEVRRVRCLPPLEEPIFRALQMQAVAVLDPFPVGLHQPVLDAMLDRVPVVTAPALQECTNSHALSLGRALHIPAFVHSDEDGGLGPGPGRDAGEAPQRRYADVPVTAEDYGVLAVRLSKEAPLREAFTMRTSHVARSEPSHAAQVVDFVSRLVQAQ